MRLSAEVGDSYKAAIELAKQRLAGQDYGAAAEWAKKALALDPSRPEAFNLLGALEELEQQWSAAQRYYRAALAFDPAYRPAQSNLHRTGSWNRAGAIALDEGE